MSENIIELRQLNDGTKVNQNGDFICQIPPLTLNKNDTLQLKQAFIDTVAKDSGKIVVPDGLTSMTFEYGLYLQDQDTSQETAVNAKDYFPPNANAPTGQNYILSSQDGAAPGSKTMCTFTQIYITDDGDNNRFVRDKIVKLYLKYKDVNGVEHPWHGEITSVEWNKMGGTNGVQPGDTFSFDKNGYVSGSGGAWHVHPPFGVICDRNAYGPNTPLAYDSDGSKYAHDGKIIFAGVVPDTFSNINQGSHFTPWTFSTTIPMLPGTAYTPVEFTKYLTRHLTNALDDNNEIPAGRFVNPLFLQSRAQLRDRGTSKSGANNNNPFWIAEDGNSALKYKDVDLSNQINYLFGSSNFDFGFDFDTNLASLDNIHSSIYNGNVQCIVPMSAGGRNFVLNKTGGIFITAITPNDAKQLILRGLNLPGEIITVPTGSKQSTLTGLGDCNVSTFSLKDGVNVTGNSRFLDGFITKNSDSSKGATFDEAPNNLPPQAGISNKGVVSDQVTNIKGTAPIGEDNDGDLGNSPVAYYQIELNSSFLFNKIQNDRRNTKISAIVNKYYSTNNYTTGDSSMASLYVHEDDEPAVISEIGVRFLNPDGSQVDPLTLQSDNSVFLSVIKQSQAQLIQQEEAALKK